jgi:hypothetical protein
MTTKSVATALALGCLAFTLSVQPVTRAEAVECYMAYDGVCTKGGVATDHGKHLDPLGVDEGFVRCCKGELPSVPYATGESAAERAARHKTEAAKLKADCENRGKRWDSASNRCIAQPVSCPEGQMLLKGVCQRPPVDPESKTGKGGGFIQMKPLCAAGTTFSESEGKCVATPAPAAEEQASDDDGDYKPKKKKKKKGQYEDGSGYEKKKKKQHGYEDDDDGDRY